ncbi:MAG: hypothetical protein ACOCV7_03055, partial [Desulfonatronovibrionaceae bacterium]
RGMIWILPVLAVLIPVTVWWQIQQSVLDNRRKIQTLASRHQQVLPLVEKILAGQKSRQEDWSDLSAMTAVQQLVRDVDLQSRLVSIAPVGSDRESQGVKIFLQNLNLIQMLAFFQGLGDQTGLFIVSGSISKSRDNQKLADLNLVLSR